MAKQQTTKQMEKETKEGEQVRKEKNKKRLKVTWYMKKWREKMSIYVIATGDEQ